MNEVAQARADAAEAVQSADVAVATAEAVAAADAAERAEAAAREVERLAEDRARLAVAEVQASAAETVAGMSETVADQGISLTWLADQQNNLLNRLDALETNQAQLSSDQLAALMSLIRPVEPPTELEADPKTETTPEQADPPQVVDENETTIEKTNSEESPAVERRKRHRPKY